jgi:excisionase family DNA binding protein
MPSIGQQVDSMTNQTNDNNPNNLGAMNADQAAAFLSVSRATLYRLVRAGSVPSKALNGRTIFLREALQEYLRQLPDGGAMGQTAKNPSSKAA